MEWSLLNFGGPITPKFGYCGQIISYLLTINLPSTNIGDGNDGPHKLNLLMFGPFWVHEFAHLFPLPFLILLERIIPI